MLVVCFTASGPGAARKMFGIKKKEEYLQLLQPDLNSTGLSGQLFPEQTQTGFTS